MASHPSQPANATYMFWIEPLEKLVAKKGKVTHLNRNWFFLEIIFREMASHPSQPANATYMFWIEPLEKHAYFQKLNILRKNLTRISEKFKVN